MTDVAPGHQVTLTESDRATVCRQRSRAVRSIRYHDERTRKRRCPEFVYSLWNREAGRWEHFVKQQEGDGGPHHDFLPRLGR
jgi:hypothetical protein